MDLTGAIITGIRTIVGAVFPPIKKKYFDQPKIYLQFAYDGASKRNLGLSPLNDASQPIDIMSAIYHHDLIWDYKLTLRNNSEHTAYNIQLLEPLQDHAFRLQPKIELLKPIQPNGELIYEAKFSAFHAGPGLEANNLIAIHPDLLRNRKFILQYTNVKGTKFYTLFDGKKDEQDSNAFSKKLK